jgi:S-adenosylmethionine hydrolase
VERSFVTDCAAKIELGLPTKQRPTVRQAATFGRIAIGEPLIVADDDGRPALAVNQGSFASSETVAQIAAITERLVRQVEERDARLRELLG